MTHATHVPIVFLSHPLTGDADNVNRAHGWLRWLIDRVPDWAFVAAWLPYVDVLDDDQPEHRVRGMRDSCAVAARCDGIVLVGGRVSRGMRDEGVACVAAGGWVADLTFLGPLCDGEAVLALDRIDRDWRPLPAGRARAEDGRWRL